MPRGMFGQLASGIVLGRSRIVTVRFEGWTGGGLGDTQGLAECYKSMLKGTVAGD
jgi:hypothetical protein